VSGVRQSAKRLVTQGLKILRVASITESGVCTCWKGADCPAPGKHPQSLRGLRDASTDVSQFTDTCNIGMPLADNGLIALDLDGYKGDLDRLVALESRLGPLPATLRTRSGSGQGWHLIYKCPPGFVARGQIEGITIRHNAYIIMPPSRHVSGGVYVCEYDGPAVDLSTAWLKALARGGDTNFGKTIQQTTNTDNEPEWLRGVTVEKRTEKLIQNLKTARPETKGKSLPGHTFNVLRCAIRGSGVSDPNIALQCVQEHYNVRCIPPWSEEGLIYKIVQCLDGTVAEPEWGAEFKPRDLRNLEIWEYLLGKDRALEFCRGVGRNTANDVPTQGVRETPTVLEEIRDFLGASKGQDKKTYSFIDGAALAKIKFPKNRWLVEGMMTEDSVCVISTSPKSAKTWAATELSIAIATMSPAFGKYITPKRRAVAYFYAEDPGASIQTRIRVLVESRGLTVEDLKDLHVIPRGETFNLLNDDHLAAIVTALRTIPNLGLLALDPFRDVHTGIEDSSDEMSEVMRRLRMISVLCKCSVLIIHHSSKDSADNKGRRGGQRMRGSSAIQGAVDCGIYFSDLDTDHKTRFHNRVEVEIKSARGAGVFGLTLDLKDDSDGSAIAAKWTVGDADKSTVAAPEVDVRKLIAVVMSDATGRLNLKQIRAKCGFHAVKLTSAVDTALAAGYIRYRNDNNPDKGLILEPAGLRKLQDK
jgi:AAA domain/Bifunctional DNA primase/polymerase, N-terminal